MFVPSLSQPISQAPDPGCQSQARPPGGPDCHPARLTRRRNPLQPSSFQLALSHRPTRSRPTCIRPTKHRLPFSPTHSPFFLSARSFYLPFPIHYITLHCPTSLYSKRHISVQHTTRVTTSLDIPKVCSYLVLSCPPRPRHSILITSTHPPITPAGSHPRLPLVSAPTTLLPLVANRQLSVPIKGSLRRLTNSNLIHPP